MAMVTVDSDRAGMRREYSALHVPTGKRLDGVTKQRCTLNELLQQLNEWNRSNPGVFVHWVPIYTQPEIGDLNCGS